MDAGKSTKEVFGCIGAVLAAVLAAFIAGFFTLIAADKISLPWSSPAATIVVTAPLPTATVAAAANGAPEAEIIKVWEEENISVDGKNGLNIHLRFNVNYLKGVRCQAVAYFYSEEGQALKDANNEYKTPAGLVASQVDFTPGYDQATFDDLVISIPYDELHLGGGQQKPKYFVSIIVVGNLTTAKTTPELDRSEMRSFAYNKGVNVQNVWQEHNIQVEGLTGFYIHLKMETLNLKNIPCKAIAYFYFDNDEPLKDLNDAYNTVDGNVSSSIEFTPIYDPASFSDLVISIPYDELHLTVGEHTLKFHVEFIAVEPYEYLGTTDDYTFTVTQE